VTFDLLITYHFSAPGTGRDIGPMYVTVCVSLQYFFKMNDISRRHLSCWFIVRWSRSKIEVIDQGSRSQ